MRHRPARSTRGHPFPNENCIHQTTTPAQTAQTARTANAWSQAMRNAGCNTEGDAQGLGISAWTRALGLWRSSRFSADCLIDPTELRCNIVNCFDPQLCRFCDFSETTYPRQHHHRHQDRNEVDKRATANLQPKRCSSDCVEKVRP